MPFSIVWERKTLGRLFGNTAISIAPDSGVGQIYIGLSTTTPTESSANTGYNFTEPPTSAGYVRKPVANTTGATASDFFDAPVVISLHGSVANRIAATFAQATGDWGTITHFGIFDDTSAPSAANLVAWAALSSPKTVGDGDTASFAVGQLKITFS